MKKNHSQEILVISILTLTITLVWIYIGVYSALKKNQKPLLTPQETRVLTPTLDTEVFEKLKTRKF